MSTYQGERRVRMQATRHALLEGIPLYELFELPGRPHVVWQLRSYADTPNAEEAAKQAREDVPFLFKAFEAGQIGPKRLAKMHGGKPRMSTIHEYLDWTVTAQAAMEDDELDFGGFRVLVLLPRFVPQWPYPGNPSTAPASKRCHPQMGPPLPAMPALQTHGKPLTAATIRSGPGYLEIPFVATHEGKRGKGYCRCLLEAIEEIARLLQVPKLMLCSTNDPLIKSTWHHLGFDFTTDELMDEWDTPHTDLVYLQNTTQMHKSVPPPGQYKSLRIRQGLFQQRVYARLDQVAKRPRLHEPPPKKAPPKKTASIAASLLAHHNHHKQDSQISGHGTPGGHTSATSHALPHGRLNGPAPTTSGGSTAAMSSQRPATTAVTTSVTGVSTAPSTPQAHEVTSLPNGHYFNKDHGTQAHPKGSQIFTPASAGNDSRYPSRLCKQQGPSGTSRIGAPMFKFKVRGREGGKLSVHHDDFVKLALETTDQDTVRIAIKVEVIAPQPPPLAQPAPPGNTKHTATSRAAQHDHEMAEHASTPSRKRKAVTIKTELVDEPLDHSIVTHETDRNKRHADDDGGVQRALSKAEGNAAHFKDEDKDIEAATGVDQPLITDLISEIPDQDLLKLPQIATTTNSPAVKADLMPDVTQMALPDDQLALPLAEDAKTSQEVPPGLTVQAGVVPMVKDQSLPHTDASRPSDANKAPSITTSSPRHPSSKAMTTPRRSQREHSKLSMATRIQEALQAPSSLGKSGSPDMTVSESVGPEPTTSAAPASQQQEQVQEQAVGKVVKKKRQKVWQVKLLDVPSGSETETESATTESNKPSQTQLDTATTPAAAAAAAAGSAILLHAQPATRLSRLQPQSRPIGTVQAQAKSNKIKSTILQPPQPATHVPSPLHKWAQALSSPAKSSPQRSSTLPPGVDSGDQVEYAGTATATRADEAVSKPGTVAAATQQIRHSTQAQQAPTAGKDIALEGRIGAETPRSDKTKTTAVLASVPSLNPVDDNAQRDTASNTPSSTAAAAAATTALLFAPTPANDASGLGTPKMVFPGALPPDHDEELPAVPVLSPVVPSAALPMTVPAAQATTPLPGRVQAGEAGQNLHGDLETSQPPLPAGLLDVLSAPMLDPSTSTLPVLDPSMSALPVLNPDSSTLPILDPSSSMLPVVDAQMPGMAPFDGACADPVQRLMEMVAQVTQQQHPCSVQTEGQDMERRKSEVSLGGRSSQASPHASPIVIPAIPPEVQKVQDAIPPVQAVQMDTLPPPVSRRLSADIIPPAATTFLQHPISFGNPPAAQHAQQGPSTNSSGAAPAARTSSSGHIGVPAAVFAEVQRRLSSSSSLPSLAPDQPAPHHAAQHGPQHATQPSTSLPVQQPSVSSGVPVLLPQQPSHSTSTGMTTGNVIPVVTTAGQGVTGLTPAVHVTTLQGRNSATGAVGIPATGVPATGLTARTNTTSASQQQQPGSASSAGAQIAATTPTATATAGQAALAGLASAATAGATAAAAVTPTARGSQDQQASGAGVVSGLQTTLPQPLAPALLPTQSGSQSKAPCASQGGSQQQQQRTSSGQMNLAQLTPTGTVTGNQSLQATLGQLSQQQINTGGHAPGVARPRAPMVQLVLNEAKGPASATGLNLGGGNQGPAGLTIGLNLGNPNQPIAGLNLGGPQPGLVLGPGPITASGNAAGNANTTLQGVNVRGDNAGNVCNGGGGAAQAGAGIQVSGAGNNSNNNLTAIGTVLSMRDQAPNQGPNQGQNQVQSLTSIPASLLLNANSAQLANSPILQLLHSHLQQQQIQQGQGQNNNQGQPTFALVNTGNNTTALGININIGQGNAIMTSQHHHQPQLATLMSAAMAGQQNQNNSQLDNSGNLNVGNAPGTGNANNPLAQISQQLLMQRAASASPMDQGMFPAAAMLGSQGSLGNGVSGNAGNVNGNTFDVQAMLRNSLQSNHNQVHIQPELLLRGANADLLSNAMHESDGQQLQQQQQQQQLQQQLRMQQLRQHQLLQLQQNIGTVPALKALGNSGNNAGNAMFNKQDQQLNVLLANGNNARMLGNSNQQNQNAGGISLLGLSGMQPMQSLPMLRQGIMNTGGLPVIDMPVAGFNNGGGGGGGGFNNLNGQGLNGQVLAGNAMNGQGMSVQFQSQNMMSQDLRNKLHPSALALLEAAGMSGSSGGGAGQNLR